MSTVSEARKFAAGVEGTSFNQAKLSSAVQEDVALLSTLKERLSLEQDLAASGASSNEAVEEWRRQMRVVEARLNANRRALSVASDAASGAMARSEALPEAGQWSVVAATRALEMVEGRIRRMDLLAAVDGQVTWIYYGPGDVVPAGMPILQVRKTGTREVVAFLTPADAQGLLAGESAAVRRATGQVVSGKLVSVGSGPQPLPPQLWRMPSWPEFGVPVKVELESEIAPDESVTVRL